MSQSAREKLDSYCKKSIQQIDSMLPCVCLVIGSLSNDDASSKMNLYFTSEICNCLDLFNAPMALKRAQVKCAMTAFNSKWKHQKFVVVGRVPQTTQTLVISRCCFAEDG